VSLGLRCAFVWASLGLAGCLVTIDDSRIGRCDGGACDAGPPAVVRACPVDLGPDPDVKQALPKALVDSAYPPTHGKTIPVVAGGSLQAALDAAGPGDVITLQAGATFTGPVTLPSKKIDGWIVVRTSTTDAALPPPGTRIDPSHAPLLAKLVANAGDSAIVAAEGSNHVRLVGIEIAPAAGAAVKTLVRIGSGELSADDLPHDIVVDRCWVHGDPSLGAATGITLNARAVAVVDSYVSDIKQVGVQSHAIEASNGSGPLRIVNDYLESAGGNAVFGDGVPTIDGIVAEDIEICANQMSKPLAWSDQGFGLGGPLVLRNARRVLVAGNVLENGIGAFAVVLSRLSVNGQVPWAVVSDVTVARNLVRHAGSAFLVGGGDATIKTERLAIVGNVVEDVGLPADGSDGFLFDFLGGSDSVVLDHNTAFQDGTVMAGGAVHTKFFVRNNIAPHNKYGVIGDASGVGQDTLAKHFPGAQFEKNILAGGVAKNYPKDNFFPGSMNAVGFVDLPKHDYALSPNSLYYRQATDGTDIGADIAALEAAIGTAVY